MGCNGMAGHTISLYMKERGYDVHGFDLKPSLYVDSTVGNAYDRELIRDVIEKGDYSAIINCVGILNQFAEQNHALAAYMNAYFPHLLAEITQEMPTRVIHMSTDCVFSGKRGQYTENDRPDGETFYDRSKALGELDDAKNITLRNSIVGPDLNPKGIGLFNWFMQQKGEVAGYTKAMWTGQTTLQLAKTMETALLEQATGLYNAVPARAISKYDLLLLFNKFMRNGEMSIRPVDGVNADKSLKRTRFDFSYLIPEYEVMVEEMSGWIREHKAMYPHYDL